MMTAEVAYRINGVMQNETWAAHRVTWQIGDSGAGRITLHDQNGAVTEEIGYRRIERVRRVTA